MMADMKQWQKLATYSAALDSKGSLPDRSLRLLSPVFTGASNSPEEPTAPAVDGVSNTVASTAISDAITASPKRASSDKQDMVMGTPWPSAVVTKNDRHVRDDVSPSSVQLSQKQKIATADAVPQQLFSSSQPSLLIAHPLASAIEAGGVDSAHAAAVEVTTPASTSVGAVAAEGRDATSAAAASVIEAAQAPPEAAAAEAAAAEEVIAAGEPLAEAAADGDDALVMNSPVHSLLQLHHSPMSHYMYCGKMHLAPLLKAGDSNIHTAVVIGEDCWRAIQHVQRDSWLKLDWIRYKTGQADETEHPSKNDTFTWGVCAALNYGGQQLNQQQWDLLLQHCEDVTTSNEAHLRKTEFEAGLDVPVLKVESRYRIKKNKCYRVGNSLEACLTSKDESKHAAFRRSCFRVTLLLLLLWHAQGKQLHPALQCVAEQYNLWPVAPPHLPPAEATSTAARRHAVCDAMQRLG